MDRERLLSMASELGITPEAVERAEKQLASQKGAEAAKVAEEKDRKEFREHRRRETWNALGSFFSVNGLMIGIWWFTGAGYFWPMWVIFGMGFAPLSQLNRGSERDFQRWRKRRDRRLVGPAEPAQIRDVLEDLALRPDLESSKLLVIKELRQRTGLTLVEAKNEVDRYSAEHGDIW